MLQDDEDDYYPRMPRQDGATGPRPARGMDSFGGPIRSRESFMTLPQGEMKLRTMAQWNILTSQREGTRPAKR